MFRPKTLSPEALKVWDEAEANIEASMQRIRELTASLPHPAAAPTPVPAPLDTEDLQRIQRMCAIVLNHRFGNSELDSLALLVGHHPSVMNPLPLLPEDAQVIEPTERTILVPVPAPVPLAERPWEREGWCDEEGRCWWFDQEDPVWVLDDATCRHWAAFSLPHNALPLPSVEVEA